MQPSQQGRRLLQVPLLRLLAINLALGLAMAVVLVGGLLVIDPWGLRHLIFSDHSPGVAIGLLCSSRSSSPSARPLWAPRSWHSAAAMMRTIIAAARACMRG